MDGEAKVLYLMCPFCRRRQRITGQAAERALRAFNRDGWDGGYGDTAFIEHCGRPECIAACYNDPRNTGPDPQACEGL